MSFNQVSFICLWAYISLTGGPSSISQLLGWCAGAIWTTLAFHTVCRVWDAVRGHLGTAPGVDPAGVPSGRGAAVRRYGILQKHSSRSVLSHNRRHFWKTSNVVIGTSRRCPGFSSCSSSYSSDASSSACCSSSAGTPSSYVWPRSAAAYSFCACFPSNAACSSV
jgi:hypothetical protein